MTGGADDDGDGEGMPDDDEFQQSFASAEARAEEARNSALDALSRIDEDDPDTSKVDALKAEQDAASTWAKHAAMAKEEGYPKAHIDAHAGQLSKEADHYTKKNLVDLVDDQSSRLRKAGKTNTGSGPPALDDWVEAELERVVRVETTDHVQSTVYRWDFTEGVVETSTTKDGITHFSWSHFRDEIYEGLGVNTTKPNRREAEEWRQWIAELIEQRGEKRETFGPRSAAVEKAQEFVADSIAFGDKADAVERGGVYTDDDPSTGNADRLCIMNSDIKRICDDCEIEVRALQQELDARGYTHDDVTGVSEGEYVNGSNIRYWVLTPDFATPAAYMEESQSPADAVAKQQADGDDDADNGATPSSVQPTVGGEGSKLASIGPDAEDTDGDTEADDADGDAEADDDDPDDSEGEST